MYIRAIIIVKGIVQGVGYRFFTVREARMLSLTGTVANLFDGSVKIVVEGEKGLIDELVKSLRIGPISSDVSDLVIEFGEYKNEFNDFRIIS